MSTGHVPPETVRAAARRGLELRKKHGKGGLTTQEAGKQGIGSGVARASNLAAGDAVSTETLRRMVAFFSRHRKNKSGGEDDAGYIAWLLWGGDPGELWAKRELAKLEKGGPLQPMIAVLRQSLRKGRTHKYLARVPTGKTTKSGKPRWRYVYKYTSSNRKSGWIDELGLLNPKLNRGLPIGTSFRDSTSNHKGHWVVTEATTTTKNGFTDVTKIVLTHDEDGTTRMFDSKYALLRFLRDAHQDGIDSERQRRKGTVASKMEAALSAFKTMKARHGAKPTMDQMTSQGRAFEKAISLANHHPTSNWRDGVLSVLFPVEPLKPKRGKTHVTAQDVAERIKALRSELSPYFYHADNLLPDDAGALPTLDLITKAAELRKLLGNGAYGAAGGDYDRLPEEITSSNRALLLEQIGKSKAELSDATIEKKVKDFIAARGGWSALRLRDNGLWIEGWSSYDEASRATPESRRGMERLLSLASRKKGWLGTGSAYESDIEKPSQAGAFDTPTRAYGVAIDRWASSDGQSSFPNPSMYGTSYDAEAEFPTTGEKLAELARDYGPDKPELVPGLRQIADGVARGAIDPIITVSHGPADKDYSRKKATAPLSVLRAALADSRKANIESHRAAHKARVRKLDAATSRVSDQIERAGGVSKLDEIAVDAAINAIRADPAFNSDAITSQTRDLILKRQDEFGKQIAMQQALGISFGGGESWNNPDPVKEALRKKLRKLTSSASRDAVLGHLVAVTGSKPDAGHSKSRLRVYSDAEHAARHAKNNPAHADKPHPTSYDPDKADPAGLGSLWAFMDSSVAPDASIDIYSKELASVTGGTRAHCGYNNVIRLHPTAGDLSGTTAWHEYGHAIEHANPGITELTNTLRDVRGAGAKLRTLNEVDGVNAYGDHEKAYLVQDENAWPVSGSYAAKWYGHQGSTEVLAMGTQHLHDDPIGFLRNDPTHAHLTIAALTGQLGAATKRFNFEV